MSLRHSVPIWRRAFCVLVVAALALLPVGSGVVPGVAPAVAKADAPVYPELGSGHPGTFVAFANAGLVDLVNPVGAPNPTAASVTAVAGDGPLEGASLLTSDLSGSQLGSTTLQSLHLETLPVDIPLSTIPITRTTAPKTWSDLLATTVLAGIPLQNITWSQVNQLTGSGRPAALNAITLAEVDFSGSVLRDLPLAALTFGGANVSTIAIPLQPGEPGTDTDNLSRWCYLINEAQAGACTDAASLTGESLIDIGVKGAPLKNIPLKNIPLKNIDLSASPLKNIPLKNIAQEVAPLKNIPLKNINLAGSPLKNIPLKNILLDGAGNPTASPLKNIPLKNIAWATSPLKNIPLKNINLATSPLKNIPLKNINFGIAPLKNIPLKNIDLAGSGIGTLPLGSIAWTTAGLGSANLSQFNLAGAPFAAIVLASTANPAGIAGCVTTLPAPTCTAGETLAMALANHDILPSATLAAIGAAGFAGPGTLSTLLGARIAGSTVDPSLGDLRLDLAGAAAPSVLLSALESALQAATGSPLPSIVLGDLSLDTAAGVDALVLDAITGNLGVPGTLDAYLLGDVGTYAEITGHDITLGELGVYTDNTGADITLGQLAQYLDDSVSLADVLLGLVPASQFPYEDFPIASLDLSAAGRPIFDPPNNQASPGGAGPSPAGFIIGSPSTFGFGVNNDFALVPSVPAELDLVFPAGSSIETVTGDPNPAVTTDPDGRVRLRVPLPSYPAGFPDGGASVTWDEGLHLGPGVVTEEIRTADGQPIPGSDVVSVDINPIQDGAEPNAPSEDPAFNSGRASLPTFPVNPSGCSGSSGDCTGKDPTYIDSMIPGFISFKGDVDWYRLPNVRAGSRITADITNLPLDADLVLYGPAGLATSPSLFPADVQGLPGQLVEDPGLGVGQAADSIAAQALGDLQLDQGYLNPLADPPIQVPALTPISISAHRGTDSEDVGAIAPVSGDYVVAVTGYNGATSNDPYLLRAKVTSPTSEASCPARSFPNPATPAGLAPMIPANANAIFLLDPGRLAATYGSSAAGAIQAKLAALVAYLNATPSLGIVPAVVPLDSYPAAASAYATWDANPCSVAAANNVAEQITGIIHGIRTTNPGLAYITIIGGDDQVPMGRVPDLTRISNESEYASTFGDTLNPLSAAEAASFTLTDDVYGDPNPTSIGNGSQIFVPQMAVGRLVEAPADIEAALDSFTNNKNGGALDTSTGLVAGYDFLSDGASAVASRLTIPGRTVDSHLIDLPGTTTPWTRDQLLASLFPTTGVSPLVDSINAHYDHTALLPSAGNAGATGQVITDSDFATLGGSDLAGRILFTMGCHAGLAVPDAYLAGTPAAATEDLDWAQELAQQNVAVYVANTGYGIGDTGSVAYSERLMALYGKLLDGSLTAGQALVYAKQAYYGSLGAVGVYDLKILQEAAFYGLPFWHIGTGNPPLQPPAAPPAPGPFSTDASTNLQSIGVSFTPDLEPQHTARGDYWTADGQDPQVTQYRPILPRASVSVVVPNLTAHGAVITSLTSHDVTGVNPVIDMPTIDLSASSPEVATPDQAWPGRLATITSSVAPYGPAQDLVIVPGQFVGSTTDGTGVQRLYTNLGATVLYAPPANTDFNPPQIASSTGQGSGPSITFTVTASDAEGPVLRVLVGYHDFDGTWQFVELANGPAGWTGTGSLLRALTPSDQVEYFVQAVDAAGNVAVSTNKGSGLAALGDVTPPTISASISPAPNLAGWSAGASATVTFACADSGSGIAPGACPAAVPVTKQGATSISGTVSDRSGNSASTSVTVKLDSVAPTITASTNPPASPAGWILASSAIVTFTCGDDTSGVAGSCPAPVTVTPASPSVSVSVSDVAGNSTVFSQTFKFDGTPPTISALVTPAPNSASWNAGSVVVSFACADSGSGIPANACPASVPVSAEGVRVVSGSVSDAAGNMASTSVTVRIDRTKPLVVASIAPAPNAAGWNKGASATVSFICTDALSGLAAGACPAPVTVTAEGTTTVTQTAADLAGNVGTGTASVKLDRTPPVVIVSGFPLLPICSTTDALSGVASKATISFTFAIVAGVPTATATCSGAIDKAGNTAAPVSKAYATPFVFVGYLAPVANPPIVNVGTAGKTYKVPFQLWTLWAARVTTLAAVTSESFASVSCSTFSSKSSTLPAGGTTASGLAYDTTANQYVYSWKTPTSKGCYVLSVKLADGSTYKADFNLK